MSRLVVATWNVHGFVWSDGRHDPEATLRQMRALDADVVALQEVLAPDEGALLTEGRRAGFEVLLGPTLERDAGPYGNALLTRLPVREVRRIDLSIPGREPRGGLDVLLEWRGRALRVVATHLGLDPDERRAQSRWLSEAVRADGKDEGRILLGDLNDWTPWGRTVSALAALAGPLSRLRTFPSRRPILPLDRVAVRVDGMQARHEVLREPAWRAASDHLPLRAVLEPSAGG